MTTGKSKLSRGKKERFLRYVLRRKPCTYILISNIAVFVLLSACLGGLIWASMRYSKMNREYSKEEEVMKKHWSDNFTFNHCLYKSLKPDWNIGFCADNCGPEAFAFRHYELDPVAANEKTCLDRMEVTMCHENFTRSCVKPRSGEDAIKACYGFQNVSMSSYLTNQNSDPEVTMVNAITNGDLQQYMNQVLLANELVLQCPQCRVLTVPFFFPDSASDDKDICYRVLKTVKKGWPKFASYCDPVDKVPGIQGDEVHLNRIKRDLLSLGTDIVHSIDELKDLKQLQSDGSLQMEEKQQCIAVPLKQT